MTQRTTLAAFRRSIPVLALSVAFFACSDESPNNNNDENIKGNSLLLNFTSDYTTGELRWMHPDSARLSEGTLPFWQDSKVSTAEGNIFILENNPGTLSCILPQSIGDKIKQERLSAEFPYGATAIGNKGYIALNDVDYIQVFNVNTCTPSEKIDLPISDANASTIKASGDTLLVTLQRLENWSATKSGLLVRINASTKTLIDTIQLKLYNPSSSVLSKGKLYVSLQGAYDPIDYSIDMTKTGIEVVDLATGTSEILKTGTELGGGAGSIALDEANQILYVTSVSVDWVTSVKSINLASKTIGSTLPDIVNASGGIVFDKAGKKLFIGDKAGLKVYDTVAKTTQTIGNQNPLLPPYSLAIVNF
ncbi:MAG: hypothetical protein LBC75_13045 [Fibromonadaceae bacterium]|jgi:hypothetical protein|nr:hypothetical protein [Fibromonadaceae bacterium]